MSYFKPIVAALLAFALLALAGCSTPEQRAQKLFDQGKYEDVVSRYPDLPLAQQAKDKIAEHLLAEGRYADVLAQYPDSPSAAQAQDKLAEELFNQGKYSEVIAQYPESPAAAQAAETLAGELLAQAQAQTKADARRPLLEQIIATYPATQAAVQAQTMLTELAQAPAVKAKIVARDPRVTKVKNTPPPPAPEKTPSKVPVQ